MNALVFTANPASYERPSRGGKKRPTLEVHPIGELARVVRGAAAGGIAYIDLRGVAPGERKKALGIISRATKLSFGVIDPAGTVEDVASLFHAGAVDYIGKKLGVEALDGPRIAAAARYAANHPRAGSGAEAGFVAKAAAEPAVKPAVKPAVPAPSSGPARDGWAAIQQGVEHRFAFLFVEADDAEEMKRRYEPQNLAAAMETFRSFIDRNVTQHGGRLWLWSRFGGLALFPLGDGECQAMVCGLRMLLSRVFYDVEESLLPGRLSFRLALSVGATVYRQVDTGHIVSDGLNSIFHLGQRFARAGQFVLTAEAADLGPVQLRPFLHPAGSFEGRRIMRMALPLPSVRSEDAACMS
jgi:class 3 adenylate cyclase